MDTQNQLSDQWPSLSWPANAINQSIWLVLLPESTSYLSEIVGNWGRSWKTVHINANSEFAVATHTQLSPAMWHLYYLSLYHFNLRSALGQGAVSTHKPTFIYLTFPECLSCPIHFAASIKVQWWAKRDTWATHPFLHHFLSCLFPSFCNSLFPDRGTNLLIEAYNFFSQAVPL